MLSKVKNLLGDRNLGSVEREAGKYELKAQTFVGRVRRALDIFADQTDIPALQAKNEYLQNKMLLALADRAELAQIGGRVLDAGFEAPSTPIKTSKQLGSNYATATKQDRILSLARLETHADTLEYVIERLDQESQRATGRSILKTMDPALYARLQDKKEEKTKTSALSHAIQNHSKPMDVEKTALPDLPERNLVLSAIKPAAAAPRDVPTLVEVVAPPPTPQQRAKAPSLSEADILTDDSFYRIPPVSRDALSVVAALTREPAPASSQEPKVLADQPKPKIFREAALGFPANARGTIGGMAVKAWQMRHEEQTQQFRNLERQLGRNPRALHDALNIEEARLCAAQITGRDKGQILQKARDKDGKAFTYPLTIAKTPQDKQELSDHLGGYVAMVKDAKRELLRQNPALADELRIEQGRARAERYGFQETQPGGVELDRQLTGKVGERGWLGRLFTPAADGEVGNPLKRGLASVWGVLDSIKERVLPKAQNSDLPDNVVADGDLMVRAKPVAAPKLAA